MEMDDEDQIPQSHRDIIPECDKEIIAIKQEPQDNNLCISDPKQCTTLDVAPTLTDPQSSVCQMDSKEDVFTDISVDINQALSSCVSESQNSPDTVTTKQEDNEVVVENIMQVQETDKSINSSLSSSSSSSSSDDESETEEDSSSTDTSSDSSSSDDDDRHPRYRGVIDR